MSSTPKGRAQALAKADNAIGRSEQAITRQLVAIAALERHGQDARRAHELLRVAEEHLATAHDARRRLLDGRARQEAGRHPSPGTGRG